jgi:hypothetical protein
MDRAEEFMGHSGELKEPRGCASTLSRTRMRPWVGRKSALADVARQCGSEESVVSQSTLLQTCQSEEMPVRPTFLSSVLSEANPSLLAAKAEEFKASFR